MMSNLVVARVGSAPYNYVWGRSGVRYKLRNPTPWKPVVGEFERHLRRRYLFPRDYRLGNPAIHDNVAHWLCMRYRLTTDANSVS